MNKDELVEMLSNHSNRYGDLIIECLDKYNKFNIIQLTIEELEEFIKEKGLK